VKNNGEISGSSTKTRKDVDEMPILAYCTTLNNYTEDDVAELRKTNPKLRYMIVGHETSSTGTRHLQIYFQLRKQVKMSTIKAWGGPWARMHFEIAKGQSDLFEHEKRGEFHKPYSATGYCMKEGNFFEIGTRFTMGKKGKRSDIDAVKQAIHDGLSYDQICDLHFDVTSRISKFVRERVMARDSKSTLASLQDKFRSAQLRQWQQELLDIIKNEPDPRNIKWIWDSKGNTGKSWMATYLGAIHGATLLTPGKKADLAFIFSQKPTSVVVFDLSRTSEPDEGKNSLDSIYSLAEDLKNGRVVSTKYESKTIFYTPCHVIFFANFPPDMSKWSPDRYDIQEL
jgi:hypothetical protein